MAVGRVRVGVRDGAWEIEREREKETEREMEPASGRAMGSVWVEAAELGGGGGAG